MGPGSMRAEDIRRVSGGAGPPGQKCCNKESETGTWCENRKPYVRWLGAFRLWRKFTNCVRLLSEVIVSYVMNNKMSNRTSSCCVDSSWGRKLPSRINGS